MKTFSKLLIFMGISHALALCILSAAPLPPASWNVESALGLEMIWVDIHSDGEPISFTKGSPEEETGHNPDENQHQVTLTQGYYLGKFEVTQAEYQAVLQNNPNGKNPSPSGFPSQNQPVENLSWDDANYFIERLNLLEHQAGHLPVTWSYTLPTEAEWEFACRAGSSSPYTSGETLDRNESNYFLNATSSPVAVGRYEPNLFGFHDMHGNVREWCFDWYIKDLNGSYSDPTGPVYTQDSSGNYRDPKDYIFYDPQETVNFLKPTKVCRGGSFDDPAIDLRSARRFPTHQSQKSTRIGFRLALKKFVSDNTLAYATIGAAATNMSANQFEVESTWDDNGESPVYSIRGNDLAVLLDNPFFQSDQDYNVSFKVRYSDKFSQLNRLGEPVPGLGYAVYLSDLNEQGDWQYNLEGDWIASDILANHLKSTSPPLLGYGSLESTQSNLYDIQSTSGAMVALRNQYLKGTFSEFLSQAPDMGNGWKWAKWFGYYYGAQFPWIYHENLGWTYISQTKSDHAWIFRKHLGWGWTSSPDWWFKKDHTTYEEANQTASFPYIYRHGYDENDTKVWTFLNPASSQTILYDFQENDWFALDQPIDINGSVVPQLGGTVSGYGQYFRWENVTLSATPSENYKFLYWGNNEDPSPTHQFIAKKDLILHASFSPTLSGGRFPQNADQLFAEMLSVREDLSDVEKSRALFEFLFTGKSPTAGVQ